MITAGDTAPAPRVAIYPGWRGVFFLGLLLWLAAVIVTGLTGNINMIPTVVLLGSFLVPVTAVIWYLDHYDSATLAPRHVVQAFIVGGTLGVLVASLLETWLLRDGLLLYLGVGLIEEFAKLAGLVAVARRLGRYVTRDGVVLGAAVGFGFAALESSGYALSALIAPQGPQAGLSLGSLVFTELLRGALAPLGHGLWTAILGGVLFSASRGATRLRFTAGVVGTFLLVAILHALWDGMRGVALFVTTLVTATATSQPAVGMGQLPPPTAQQFHTFLLLEFGGWIAISLVGLLTLRGLWHRAPADEARVA